MPFQPLIKSPPSKIRLTPQLEEEIRRFVKEAAQKKCEASVNEPPCRSAVSSKPRRTLPRKASPKATARIVDDNMELE